MHDRFKTTIAVLFGFVVEVDPHNGLFALSDSNISQVNVLDDSSPAVVGFDA
jgi:hypothetical protein